MTKLKKIHPKIRVIINEFNKTNSFEEKGKVIFLSEDKNVSSLHLVLPTSPGESNIQVTVESGSVGLAAFWWIWSDKNNWKVESIAMN